MNLGHYKYEQLLAANPHMAAAIHDYVNDGGFVAWSFIEKEKEDCVTQTHRYFSLAFTTNGQLSFTK